MSWAGGLSFPELVALVLLILVTLVVLGPEKAVHLIKALRGKNDREIEAPPSQRRVSGPFLIPGGFDLPNDPSSDVEIEKVKAHLERLDEAVLGPRGLVARAHTMEKAQERLEAKVDAQPTMTDFTRWRTEFSRDVFKQLEEFKSWLKAGK